MQLINSVGSVLVIGAVALRLHNAPLSSGAIRSEQVLILLGVVYAVPAIALRASPLTRLFWVQASLAAVNTLLAGAVLAIAAPYLPDFLPVACLVFATLILNFDIGFDHEGFFAIGAIPVVGLAGLWVYYVAVLHGSPQAVAVWTGLLAGVALLAYLTIRVLIDRTEAAGNRYESLLHAISDMGEALIITEGGRLIACNEAYLQMTGYTLEELQALPSLIELSPAEDREQLAEQLRRRLGGATSPFHYEAALVRKDGRRVEVENSVRMLIGDQRHRLLAVVRDVTERKRTDAALRESEQRVRAVLESVGEGIVTIDEDGIIESANPAIRRLFGYSPPELVGRHVRELVAPEQAREFLGYLEARTRHAPQRETSGLHESVGRRRNGSLLPIDLLINDMHLASGRLYVVSIRDISERRAHMDALEYQALHDALTGLPNRTLFQDRLNHSVQTAPRSERPFAVLLMDLDHFKDVNDVLGHDSGDLLLAQVADRIRRTCRGADTVARLGGDEFAVLTGLSQGELEPAILARKVLESLEAPFQIREREVKIGASIGIALYPEHGQEARALIRRADVAMYAAKRDGQGLAVYEPAQEQSASRRLLLMSELRRALENGELVLEYQPVIELATGRPVQAEALIRWHHPHEGTLAPDSFIPLAEESGMIAQITQWVAAAALEDLRAWRAAGIDISISINISARDLRQFDFATRLRQMITRAGVPAGQVTLEVTEGHLLAADATTHASRIIELGAGLALDDFGIGYSSLSYLRQLPLTLLKIDRSFVSSLGVQPDSAAIVRSAVELGHALGYKVIAEGVEDESVREQLTEMGCDFAQGHLFGRAMPSDLLIVWVQNQLGKEAAV